MDQAGLERHGFCLDRLADDKSNTLYVCSDDFSAAGITIPGHTPTALKLFDLKTGEPKGSFPTPGAGDLVQ